MPSCLRRSAFIVWACAACAAGAATQPEPPLAGTWEFSTVGTTPGCSTTPQDYTQKRVVTLSDAATGFTPNPLGFKSAGFRLRKCQPGGEIAFDTPYSIGGGNCDMSFNGIISADGNRMTGKFSFIMAAGTFTAVREAVEQASTTLLKVQSGGTVELPLKLTLKPPAAVTAAVSVGKGLKVTALPASISFAPSSWESPQPVTIDASALAADANGKAVIEVRAEGLPVTLIPVQVVRAAKPAKAKEGAP
jgi:hypothetical protein